MVFKINKIKQLAYFTFILMIRIKSTYNNKAIQIPSKHNRFIILYHFRATCFDCLKSSSGPLMN